jgi:hypothetical protein
MTNLVGTPFCQAGVGIQEHPQDQSFIEIYNPNGTLSIASKTPFEISLFDMQGKRLKTQTFAAGNHSIDMHEYAKGMYLLEAKTGNEKRTQKILKD